MGGLRVRALWAPWVACAVGSIGCGSVQEMEEGSDAPMDASTGTTADAAPIPGTDAAEEMLADAAPADAPPSGLIEYDVAYINNFTLTPDIATLGSFVAIVNMGDAPLDLSTVSIVMFTDDDVDVEWSFAQSATSTAMLSPGRAAGRLSVRAADLLADVSLTEPRDDQILNFAMNLSTPASAGSSFLAEAVISVEGVQVALPISIAIGPTGGDVTLNGGQRVNAAGF